VSAGDRQLLVIVVQKRSSQDIRIEIEIGPAQRRLVPSQMLAALNISSVSGSSIRSTALAGNWLLPAAAATSTAPRLFPICS